jgi:hypothetical protein
MNKLNVLHPQGMKRQGEDRTVFIYDATLFESMGYGKKRIQLMLELCLDQAVEIYEGPFEATLLSLMRQFKCEALVAQVTYHPELTKSLERCAEGAMAWVEDPLMMLDVRTDQPSFFKFYKRVVHRLKRMAEQHG